jgi:lysophospholipase L1-like esterase
MHPYNQSREAAMSKHVILFLGDSLVDFGKWRTRLPHYQVISSGIPGEHAEELLSRLPARDERIGVDVIVLMTGTNNLFFGDITFTDTIASIIERLTHTHPNACILLTSLLPYRISGIEKTVRKVNETLRMIAQKSDIVYFDLYSAFVQCKEDLFDYDGVHLSETGYRLWANLLDDDLARRLEKDSY